MMYPGGSRYTDDEDGADSMHEVEDYTSDYYETQPGDVISSTTNLRRARKKNFTALGLLALGTVLVIGGIGIAMKNSGSKSSSMAATRPPADFVASPTKAPSSWDHQETETLGPTHSSLYGFVASLVGEQKLKDENSLAFKALTFLEETHDESRFGNMRLTQRFALACVYLATTVDGDWDNTKGWMSQEDECVWHGVSCKMHEVVALNLTDNGLHGLIPWEITLLKDSLLALDVSNNHISNEGSELAWIGELTKLRLLDIENTYFSYDGVPPYISQLSDLKILDISENYFIGDLDGSIFAPLTQLLYLEMGGNLFNSTMPVEISKLPNLEALYAYDNGLEGDVEFLSHLKNVVEVWLDDNPDLGGSIPTQIGHLTNMASLSVSNCDMEGPLPTEIGKLVEMEQMWFYGNWFNGSIPSEFANLPKLQILGVEDNSFADVSMPKAFCQKNMLALSADCGGDTVKVTCDCCTCCEAPCPIANLPSRGGSGRFLEVMEEIRRL